MLDVSVPEVFTPDELARAVGAPRSIVDAALVRGHVRLIPGTRFIAAADAIAAGRELRIKAQSPKPKIQIPIDPKDGASVGTWDLGFGHWAFSSAVHALLVIGALWIAAVPASTTAAVESSDPPHLVFIVSPGPGGGGGGGGLRNPLPARRLQRQSIERPRLSVPPPPPAPEPVVQMPEPAPVPAVVAPVVAVAAAPQEAPGVIEAPQRETASQGSGIDGGAGTGQGSGNGEGAGPGIGEGSGGGTGGGPYRPGSGIAPPRLLKEVKADYTDEARRRNIAGDVVLEIVVRRDGSVGDVTVMQGLGAGLDQKAVAAVRQWRFAPAQRQGVPVDVIVEVAVEFTLR
jgi:TonB family protein